MNEIDIPFPQGFAAISEFPRLRENLLNLINLGENRIVSRCGIASFATGIGACRGQATFQDELYQISGESLIKIEADGTVTDISTAEALPIAGAAQVRMAAGYTYLVITVKGDRGYAWNGVNLVEITDIDYVDSVDVCYINGRWVFVPEDGSPAFCSDALDPLTINSLAFFDAEDCPDKNIGCENIRNRLYLFGEETTQVFRDTGAGNQPFLPVDGASIQTGLVGSSAKVQYMNTVIFLGKDKFQNYGIFMVGSGEAPRVSNPAVDELLNESYTVDELRECIANRFQWKGSDIAVFRLQRHTLYFVNGNFGFFASLATFEEHQLTGNEYTTWRANYITHCYGEYFVGDVQTDDIGKLADLETDYGAQVHKELQTFARGKRGDFFTAQSLEIDGLTGQATPAGTLGLSVSEDGLLFGPRFYISMGELGRRTQRLVFEMIGGLGFYENFMGIRLHTTSNVEFAAESMTLVVE